MSSAKIKGIKIAQKYCCFNRFELIIPIAYFLWNRAKRTVEYNVDPIAHFNNNICHWGYYTYYNNSKYNLFTHRCPFRSKPEKQPIKKFVKYIFSSFPIPPIYGDIRNEISKYSVNSHISHITHNILLYGNINILYHIYIIMSKIIKTY